MKFQSIRSSHINWALTDQAVVSGSNFLMGILLARSLGIDEFGRFTLAWMVVILANAVQHALIMSPMMSIGPKQPLSSRTAYYGATIVQHGAFALLVTATIGGGSAAIASLAPALVLNELILPLSFATAASLVQDFVRRYFFANERGLLATIMDSIRYVGQILLLLVVVNRVIIDASVALWVIGAAAALAAAISLPSMGPLSFSIDYIMSLTERHWSFGKWLTGAAILQWVSGQFLFVVAGTVFGTSVVGALRASQNLLGLVHILIQGLENAAPAKAATIYVHNGYREMLRFALRVLVYGELITVAVAVIAAVNPIFWLTIVFGESYAEYGSLLRWVSLSYVVAFIRFPIRTILRTTEQTRAMFMSISISSVTAIAIYYPLSRLFGWDGLGLGLVLVELSALLSLIVIALRVIRNNLASLTEFH